MLLKDLLGISNVPFSLLQRPLGTETSPNKASDLHVESFEWFLKSLAVKTPCNSILFPNWKTSRMFCQW